MNNTAEMLELIKRPLPKWPQMLVYGEKVTPEQAAEVIRRTDTFLTQGQSGNNRDFEDRVKQVILYPSYSHMAGQLEMEAKFMEFHETWGSVKTEYVRNCWVACPYVFGPHGWMQTDGRIQFGDNVGKYPEVEDVLADWIKIAEAFPFLMLDAVLMDGEGCEADDRELEPVSLFRVREGEVELLDPNGLYIPFSAFGHGINTVTDVTRRDVAASLSGLLGGSIMPDGRTRENAIPLTTIQEWADQAWS